MNDYETVSSTILLGITHLLWIQDFNDLCDGPRVKCRDDTAAGRQKLQLECLKTGQKENNLMCKQVQSDLFALKESKEN